MTVMVIIAILCLMAIPVYSTVKNRVAKVNCMANLKSLYVATNTYVQQYNHWPQIDPKLIRTNPKLYADDWITTLQPFGVGPSTWICPTVQASIGNPDYTKLQYERSDYIATPFDDKSYTPHKWDTQPWFAERGNVHGNGNLLIMSNGSMHELNDLISSQKK